MIMQWSPINSFSTLTIADKCEQFSKNNNKKIFLIFLLIDFANANYYLRF